MHYLLLCCIDEKSRDALPARERDEVKQKYDEWTHAVVRSGHCHASGTLRSAAAATTVRGTR